MAVAVSAAVGRPAHRWRQTAVGAGSVLLVLLAWQLWALRDPLFARYLSSPRGVAAAAVRLAARGDLWIDVRASLTVFAIGLLAALAVGLVLGVGLGWYRTVYALVNPLLQVYNVLPSVVLVPILMLVLGLGTASKVTITVVAASKAVLFNMIAGVQTIDPEVLRASRSFGATDAQIFRLVVLPSTIPYLVAALRQAGGLALLGVVLGEFFVAGAGVGSLILRASFTLRTDEMFVGIFTLVTLALGIDAAIRILQARVMRW